MTTALNISRLSAREKRLLATRMLLAAGGSDGLPLRVCAFVRGKNGTTPGPDDVRNFLSGRLPEYMLPARVEAVTEWPTLPNGKVDRNRLWTIPPAAAKPAHAPETVAERFESEGERTLCEVASAVGSSRVDLQACKLEYSIVSPK